MPVSTLTSKYQATIPRAVREALALGVVRRVCLLTRKRQKERATKYR